MNEEKEMSWEELNEGLEAMLIISEFEKICGEMPKHRFKIFAAYNIGQWLDNLHIFKSGYEVGKKEMLRRIVNSGWLRPDCQRILEEQLDGKIAWGRRAEKLVEDYGLDRERINETLKKQKNTTITIGKERALTFYLKRTFKTKRWVVSARVRYL